MSQEPQFTPGPWHLAGCHVIGQGKSVALTQSDADARLIVEAPAMFELIQRYAGYANNGCTCVDCTAGRALIARVLGEEN